MVPSLSEEVALLETAELTVRGFLANASNHTMLVRVGEPDSDVHAVYKPQQGERPLWDFPPGTLYQREVAAYVLSDFLGWDIVPPTIARDGPYGMGSVQEFVLHDPERHYFVLIDEPAFERQLARIAYFDLLINNADRKGSHVLLDESRGALLGIDHGVSFHTEPKLRTVIWDLGAARIDPAWQSDVERLLGALHGGLGEDLAALLSVPEIDALGQRAEALRALPCLPEVPRGHRPYPWPPL